MTISGASITGQNFTGTIATFTVTPSAGSNGSLSPLSPQTVNYNSTVSFTALPSAGYHLASVSGCGATFAGNIITTAPITANCTVAASFALNFGIFGATSVSVQGGYVDSYDSSKGPYNGTHGQNGGVGTNSTARGAITLGGGAVVYGNVWVGPGGDPAKAVTLNGGSTVKGTKAALSSPRDMTPMTDPGGGTPISFVSGTTLTSGTYRASSINLTGGTATINGNVILYVTGDMKLSGSAQIVISAGSSLTVYVSGSISIGGGGMVNQTLNPHSLTVYGTSTCTSATFSGNSVLYGAIYTPKATTSVSGCTSFYGSVIGGSVSISGGTAVHYDESLGW